MPMTSLRSAKRLTPMPAGAVSALAAPEGVLLGPAATGTRAPVGIEFNDDSARETESLVGFGDLLRRVY